MSGPSLAFFARHEIRLALRDWVSIMTAGKPERLPRVLVVIAVMTVGLHWISARFMADLARERPGADLQVLLTLTGAGLLGWFLMFSQALESVTRVLYARGDVDLLLSSPIEQRAVFAVRLTSVAVTSVLMTLVLSAAFVNMLAWYGGPRWFGIYLVVLAIGASSAAAGMALAALLFRLVGPRRTRLAAQVLGAIVGGGFLIGIQIWAIVQTGQMSSAKVFTAPETLAMAPPPDSFVWFPARAFLGDPWPLFIVAFTGFGLLWLAVDRVSRRFGAHVLAASTLGAVHRPAAAPRRLWKPRSTNAVLRGKELMLLKRDPWLVSQTLMQMIYLVPPAVLLWRDHVATAGSGLLVVPVVVMAAGQLAGGLAWLAISGEDAPDLIATAPLAPGAVLQAKIEAVIVAASLPIVPLALALSLFNPVAGIGTILGAMVSAGSATFIQLCFRSQAKRSHFSRRQVSSRIATVAEALSSVCWAATAALIVSGLPIALFTALGAMIVLMLVWRYGPSGRRLIDYRIDDGPAERRARRRLLFTTSPDAGVAHAEPRLGRGQGVALLQNLDGNEVR